MAWRIDMKVFCTIPVTDLPLLPDSLFTDMIDGEANSHGARSRSQLVLTPGYKSVVVDCSEDALEIFEDWAFNHGGDIKIIGTTEITHKTF